MAITSKRQVLHRIYQYYQISSSFLYCALLARWVILAPLVTGRFLPGGIHEFLINLMGASSIIELLWLVLFHGFKKGLLNRTALKDLNFLYFVVVMHFHDDYEHAVILKNTSYSSFIMGIGFTQAYSHYHKLFKGYRYRNKKTFMWKVNSFIMMPLLYLSEFYLLLLNTQNYNYHSTPFLNKLNKCVLVFFIPIALTTFKKYISRGF